MSESERTNLTGKDGVDGSAESANALYSLLWVLVLLVLAWPVSSIVSGVYILLLPFAACIPALNEVMTVLLKLVNLPGTIGHYIKEGKSCESVRVK